MPRRTATGVPPSVRDADIGRLLVARAEVRSPHDLVSAKFQRSLRVRRAGWTGGAFRGWRATRRNRRAWLAPTKRSSTEGPIATTIHFVPHGGSRKSGNRARAGGRVTPRRAPG